MRAVPIHPPRDRRTLGIGNHFYKAERADPIPALRHTTTTCFCPMKDQCLQLGVRIDPSERSTIRWLNDPFLHDTDRASLTDGSANTK